MGRHRGADRPDCPFRPRGVSRPHVFDRRFLFDAAWRVCRDVQSHAAGQSRPDQHGRPRQSLPLRADAVPHHAPADGGRPIGAADLWTLYVNSLAYLPGELLLGTVLYEYVGLGTRDTRAPNPTP